MKIKKVDDKPMVIHTKEKAKIHAHEPKGAKIKGSNIYMLMYWQSSLRMEYLFPKRLHGKMAESMR